MLHRYASIAVQRREEHGPQRGFTAIELMVVVAILAVLTALALPSFTDMVRRYRVRRAVEDLVATIYLARVEGIKRGGNVTLRKSTATGCTTSAGNPDWSCGWELFVDANGDGARNAGDTLLQTSPVPKGVNVTLSVQKASLSFNRWGEANNLGAFGVTLRATDPPGDTATYICVSGGGRIRQSSEACS